MISPTLESFKRKINSGNLIPVFKNIDIDIENPSLILKNISLGQEFFMCSHRYNYAKRKTRIK